MSLFARQTKRHTDRQTEVQIDRQTDQTDQTYHTDQTDRPDRQTDGSAKERPANSADVTYHSTVLQAKNPDQACSGLKMSAYWCMLPTPCSPDGNQTIHQPANAESTPHTHNDQSISIKTTYHMDQNLVTAVTSVITATNPSLPVESTSQKTMKKHLLCVRAVDYLFLLADTLEGTSKLTTIY
ncbi:hypothetical protein BsWGS_07541 [Bradybaena similaris]